jgi:Uma2 family endonuclease
MVSVAPRHHVYSYADYLALERDSNVRHEYLDGEIYAMAGGTPEHALLCAAVITDFGARLRGGPCRIATSDLRVRVVDTGLATYPDVTVICGALELDPADDKRHTIVNPTVLVEVTSKSTEAYDRGEKFEHYSRIPSLREYLLVSHRMRSIEVRRRRGDGTWSVDTVERGRLGLEAIDGVLDVDALYDAALGPSVPAPA